MEYKIFVKFNPFWPSTEATQGTYDVVYAGVGTYQDENGATIYQNPIAAATGFPSKKHAQEYVKKLQQEYVKKLQSEK